MCWSQPLVDGRYQDGCLVSDRDGPETWNVEDRDHAQAAARTFADAYGTKWPKVAAKITDDLDVLLAFYAGAAS